MQSNFYVINRMLMSISCGFVSLCGCGGLRHATRLFEGCIAFCGCNVFLRLFRCGMCDFLHKHCMVGCWKCFLVDVNACCVLYLFFIESLLRRCSEDQDEPKLV